jgi:hypothetical protein
MLQTLQHLRIATALLVLLVLAPDLTVAQRISKLMGSAAQVTTESSASGITALDLVSADDILGADSDLQRAFVLDCYGTFGACAFGHHPFATN